MVNGLIGLPTLQAWKMVLDMDANKAYSKSLCLSWNMEFINAVKGLPSAIQFQTSDFV